MAKLALGLDSRFVLIWCGYRSQTGILIQGGRCSGLPVRLGFERAEPKVAKTQAEEKRAPDGGEKRPVTV